MSISSPRDKIVEKALQLALSIVYEQCFSPHSHGFRPSRGCHSALNQVRMEFAHCRWIIESDIRKCFDYINHKILLSIISRKITCPITLELVDSALKAGYIDSMGDSTLVNIIGPVYDPLIGKSKRTPACSVLSPLLCNIYLNEMDMEIQSIINQFNCGKVPRINPK